MATLIVPLAATPLNPPPTSVLYPSPVTPLMTSGVSREHSMWFESRSVVSRIGPTTDANSCVSYPTRSGAILMIDACGQRTDDQ